MTDTDTDSQTDKSVTRADDHPRVKIVRMLSSSVVQVVGIVSLATMELVALERGLDGALVLPIGALIAGLVGLKAREIIEATRQ